LLYQYKSTNTDGRGALGIHAPAPATEESVKDFIYRHLGEAVYKKIIDPFVSGVYAGESTYAAVC
jgi:protoporphyrinogen oxidase